MRMPRVCASSIAAASSSRPIVVYADDWDVYRETRGVYFDLMGLPPGRVPGRIEE